MMFIHCHSIDAHHLVDLSPHVLRQATDTPTGTQPRCVVEYHIHRRLGSFGITREQRLRKECLINPQARCAGRNQFEPRERGTWTFSMTMWPIGIFRCGLWLDQSVKVQVVARHRGEYAHEKSVGYDDISRRTNFEESRLGKARALARADHRIPPWFDPNTEPLPERPWTVSVTGCHYCQSRRRAQGGHLKLRPDATPPLSFLQLLFAASFAFAQNWTVTPLIPPVNPLAVRGPYPQSWMDQGVTNGSLNSGWQSYRDGSKLTWTGFFRVDGQLFDWMGDRQNYTPAVQKKTVVLSGTKRSSLQVHFDEDSYCYDLREVRLDRHLSEPEPDRGCLQRREPTSSRALHRYRRRMARPVTPDKLVQWSTTVGDVVTHQFSPQNQTQFGEVNSRLRYGSVVYSTEQDPGLTYQAGAAGVVKPAFLCHRS
ncbi:hypothetical protein BJ322DRAFT_1023873 [Thelephora terrestris]|uniref:Glutaminase A N-terminal domain-containing protein n=1 Tax=Thelephora terrestris TaxID=56493 RepID=A0A9P6H9P9_9AGAM|nr:hypothetical protein BJ322DRAFT_1023873 [Thelephora terrestris]